MPDPSEVAQYVERARACADYQSGRCPTCGALVPIASDEGTHWFAPSDTLIEKLSALAHRCGDEEVRAWIARHLAETIRRTRSKRKRGARVRLVRINREVVIDAALLDAADDAMPMERR